MFLLAPCAHHLTVALLFPDAVTLSLATRDFTLQQRMHGTHFLWLWNVPQLHHNSNHYWRLICFLNMFLLCLFYLLFFLCKRYGIVMVNGALNAAKCKCKCKYIYFSVNIFVKYKVFCVWGEEIVGKYARISKLWASEQSWWKITLSMGAWVTSLYSSV